MKSKIILFLGLSIILLASCTKVNQSKTVISGSKWVVTRYDILQSGSGVSVNDTLFFESDNNYRMYNQSHNYSIGDYSQNNIYTLRLVDFVTLGGTSSAKIGKSNLDAGVINSAKFTRISDSTIFYVWMHRI